VQKGCLWMETSHVKHGSQLLFHIEVLTNIKSCSRAIKKENIKDSPDFLKDTIQRWNQTKKILRTM
jgi:hypothetical protein